MLYSLSFTDWQVSKRLDALKSIGLEFKYHKDTSTVEFKDPYFGSGHTEVVKFICDPVYNPKMWILDLQLCRLVNNLHHEFWCWKNKQVYFNAEEKIAFCIRDYIHGLECEEQDKWLEIKPEELKEKVNKECNAIFGSGHGWDGNAGKNITHLITLSLVQDNMLSWILIHSKLF